MQTIASSFDMSDNYNIRCLPSHTYFSQGPFGFVRGFMALLSLGENGV